jgi:hypothetical protein
MTTDTAVVASEKRSRWEDLVDVFFAPGDLFEHRMSDGWGKPFLLLAVISIVLYYVFLPINGQLFEVMMRQNAPANVTPEQMHKSAVFMSYLGGVFIAFGLAFGIALSAVILKIVSAVLEPAAGWQQAFMIATYSMFVVIPQSIISALLVFVKTRSGGTLALNDVSFGVLRFMDQPDKVLTAVLGRFDLFPIWSAALCAVGLIVVVKMPRGKAIATAIIAWLAVALPALAGAAMQRGGK